MLVAIATGCAAVPATAHAAPSHPPYPPEVNGAVDLLPRPCALEGNDPYERDFYRREGWGKPDYERYPGDCRRLRFSYGPITVKPGQNDVLLEPVKIEKPMRDGYITRFEPNLVLPDGSVPPIERVHLHHGTWISAPDYGSGPFFAAGEEKTIAPFPKGYGMPVKATDQWFLLYMVHSAVQEPMTVYITYDIDFVPQANAERLGLKPAYPVWLDVRPSGYPVFNTQRGYGKKGECTWPKDECARFDPYGKQIVGQGEAGNGKGEDLVLPAAGEEFGRTGSFTGGTLIGIGGHLHPGGLQNEIDLVRNGRAKRIYTGKAAYWKRRRTEKPGGPPTSWDFSMRVNGAPYWGVHVKPGDALRSNATYDTKIQSTYENMGIAVALFAPNDENGRPTAPGVDPFKAAVDHSTDCESKGLLAKGKPRLCDEGGIVTHGHLAENDNFGGAKGEWTAQTGSPTTEVGIADFIYAPGDLTTIEMTGVPTVKLGETLNFTNFDGAAIYHTVTSCAFPCLGETGTAFPLSDGQTSTGRRVDFDSSELGVGPPAIGPAKNELRWGMPISADEGYKPGEVVTYFCRIHPSMRGAFEVTE
jgi:plastocyanin